MSAQMEMERQYYCKGNVLVAFIEPSELLWISVKPTNTAYMKGQLRITKKEI